MTLSRNTKMVSAVCGVFGVLAALFFILFESIEVERRAGASLEARRNPFLAAGRFLEKLDIPVAVVKGTGDGESLPPVTDTIIIRYNHGLEIPQRSQELMAWVAAGGHLIIEVRFTGVQEDLAVARPFLDQLGISAVRKNLLLATMKAETTSVTIYEDAQPLEVKFSPVHVLELTRDDVTFQFADDNGVHMVEYIQGEGTVTVMSDFDMWRNDDIGERDHAAFLAHTVGNNVAKVWFLQDQVFPGVVSLLWRYAAEAVISAALLLGLLLLRLNNRFGPVLEYDRGQRRSLVEHLEAVGEFDWQYQRGGNLLAGMRQELHFAAETACPGWLHKSADEQAAWLARRSKQAAEDVHAALFAAADRQNQFVWTVKTLQIIRKNL